MPLSIEVLIQNISLFAELRRRVPRRSVLIAEKSIAPSLQRKIGFRFR